MSLPENFVPGPQNTVDALMNGKLKSETKE